MKLELREQLESVLEDSGLDYIFKPFLGSLEIEIGDLNSLSQEVRDSIVKLVIMIEKLLRLYKYDVGYIDRPSSIYFVFEQLIRYN